MMGGRQVEQHTPQVVAPPRQTARTHLLHPGNNGRATILAKQPAQLPPVAVRQHTLNHQFCVRLGVQAFELVFLETGPQAVWDTARRVSARDCVCLLRRNLTVRCPTCRTLESQIGGFNYGLLYCADSTTHTTECNRM